MPEKFYVTTAIDYVNGSPHVGHAMEKVGADVLARYKRALGVETWLVLGSDEHSQSVEREAREQGRTPEEFTDDMEVVWRRFWDSYQIQVDEYVRSSSAANRATTDEFMNRIHEAGYIYRGKYGGYYCPSCEQFYPKEELRPDGSCPEHPNIHPEWVEEENYFFRASAFEDQVRELLERPDFLQPEERRREMLNAISAGLRDVSISRSFTRWGFPLPFDSSQVIYVWFDALLCYVTGVGFARDQERFEKFWPCDVHVIGKGITRFHTLMWPAMLLAAGVELPRRVFAHGYVNIAGERMSKSRGLFFDPARLVDIFGSDGSRFLLMREFPFDRDADFDLPTLAERFNSELANDLGNLASRTLTMIERFRDGRIPEVAQQPSDLPLDEVVERVDGHMNRLAFDLALRETWRLVAWANRHIDEKAPWSLAKDPSRAAELDEVLYRCAETVRLLAHLLTPYIPTAMTELRRRLGDADEVPLGEAVRWGRLRAGSQISGGAPLFPRLDRAAIAS